MIELGVGVADHTDEALAAGLAGRDEASVQALLDGYWERGYRVALGLTGDPAKAEDAVQEAVLTAIRIAASYDPSRGSFQGWFFQIVHNRARDQRRASARRRRYEEQAAARRRERVTAALPDDEVGIVLRELAELDPKLRAAVTLRFVEGLSFREIGETLGWPEGTATTRVRRGLKQLRGRLRELETLSPALLAPAALARLLRGPFAPAPTPPNAGRLLRPRSAPPVGQLALPKLAAGLGALLLLGWLLAARMGGDAAPVVPGDVAQASPTPSASPAGPGPETNGRAAGQAQPTPAATGAAGSVPGPALDPTPDQAPGPGAGPAAGSGAGDASPLVATLAPRPLQDAWVSLLEWDYGTGNPLHHDAHDREAAAAIRRVLGGWEGAQGHELAAAVPATQDDLRLGACYPVGPDGQARLPLTKPGRYRLAVGARGCANQTGEVEVDAEGQVTPLALELPWIGVAEVDLQLVDAAGEPLSGAEAFLVLRSAGIDALPGRQANVARATRTPDAQGRLRLALPPGLTFLKAHVEGLASPIERCELRAGTHPGLTLRLLAPTQGELVVRVVDREGQPVAGAAIGRERASPEAWMRPVYELVSPEYYQRTDAEGVARFPDLRLGSYVVVARAGVWGGRSETVLLDPPGGARELTVVLDEPIATGHLRVRALDPEGEPLREGERFLYTRFALTVDGAECHVAPDADGSLLLADLPVGAVQLEGVAMARPRQGSTDELELETGEPVAATVEAGVTREVTLRLSPRVIPPSRALVTLTYEGTAHAPRLTHAACAQGGVQAVGLPGTAVLLEGTTTAPTLDVIAWTDLHFPVALRVATDGGEQAVPLEDAPAWTFEVVDEAGEPLAGAELDAVDLPWDRGAGRGLVEAIVYRLEDAATWTLHGQPQSLRVSHPECRGTTWRPPVDGRPPAEPIRLVLRRRQTGTAAAAVVRGVVFDPDGWPAFGVRVNVVNEAGEVERGETGPDGRFELTDAPSGRLTVFCYRGDLGISALSELEVAPSEVREGVEVHYGQTVEVRGEVRGHARRAQRVRIDALDPQLAELLRGELKFRTGGARALRLGRWPAGRWRFELTDAQGEPLASQVLELQAGQPAPPLVFDVR